MEFLNPWGLISFISVPALIALYILKQKHKEIKVPSLLLWQKTMSMMDASTPWQKLKKNLLFFLQLILLILLCLAISRPAFASENIYDEMVVVIDSSASMNAVESGRKRFDKAVKQVADLAEGLKKGEKMSVIFAGDIVEPALSHSTNVFEIKKALESYSCGYAGCDMENAFSLAESMLTEGGNGIIVIYTDEKLEIKDSSEKVKVINVSESKDNVAITNISCGVGESSYTVLTTIQTYENDRNVTLELYIDGVLKDAKKVEVKVGLTSSVYWKNIDLSGSLAKVKIVESDILPLDNEISIPLSKTEEKKVVLVSEQSFFLEKLFNAMGGYQIFKISPEVYDTVEKEQYDLYVFDSFVPKKMPENGSVWFFAPDSGFEKLLPETKVGTVIKGTTLSVSPSQAAKEITQYLSVGDIALSKFTELTLDYSWETVANCGLYPAIAIKQCDDGQYITVFAFDIHNSNLPLLKEYPILTQNIISYTMPEFINGSGLFDTGSIPDIRAVPYSTSVKIETTDGSVITLAPPFPVNQYKLDKPGVYEITQNIQKSTEGESKDDTYTGYISAKIPENESAMVNSFVKGESQTKKNQSLKGQKELWPYILILAFLMLLGEWWVYYREY